LVDEAGEAEGLGADPAHRASHDGSAWVLRASTAGRMEQRRDPPGTGPLTRGDSKFPTCAFPVQLT
jgi:hypothetical protein